MSLLVLAKSLARRVDAWFYAPAPPERSALLRIFVGAYAVVFLLARGAHLNRVTSYPSAAFAPVGPVSVLDAPLAPSLVYTLYAASVVTGVAFTLGWSARVLAPTFALLLLWVTSYRHSWGMIFHTDNLLVLHVLLLAFSPSAHALAWSPPWRPRPPSAPPPLNAPTAHGRYGWAARTMALVTIATYVIAGIAKLENTGLHWAFGDALREQIAYDAVRKIELGSVSSPLAPWLVRMPWLFPPPAAFTLAVELLAPLALLGTRFAVAWSAAAWAFHFGVLAAMAIVFPYPLSGCAFLCLLPVEKLREAALVRRLGARWSRLRPRPLDAH